MGDIDKVWELLADRPVVWHALTRLFPVVGACVLVVRADQIPRASRLFAEFERVTVVAGGDERQDSVRRGLEAIGTIDTIAVHDVARPMATAGLLAAGLHALEGCDGAIPVLPVADTIKQVEGIDVVATLDRHPLRAAQTPQLFRREALSAAHDQCVREGRFGTDDAQLLEMAGFRVRSFPGDPSNFKITTPDDLRFARLLIEREISL
jgi:2-C-methyl-D-erythritol 4-phosphate cytidylyltransferase